MDFVGINNLWFDVIQKFLDKVGVHDAPTPGWGNIDPFNYSPA